MYFILVKWGIRSKSRSDNSTSGTRLLRRDHDENIHAWSVCTQPWLYQNVSTSGWSATWTRYSFLKAILLRDIPTRCSASANKLPTLYIYIVMCLYCKIKMFKTIAKFYWFKSIFKQTQMLKLCCFKGCWYFGFQNFKGDFFVLGQHWKVARGILYIKVCCSYNDSGQ